MNHTFNNFRCWNTVHLYRITYAEDKIRLQRNIEKLMSLAKSYQAKVKTGNQGNHSKWVMVAPQNFKPNSRTPFVSHRHYLSIYIWNLQNYRYCNVDNGSEAHVYNTLALCTYEILNHNGTDPSVIQIFYGNSILLFGRFLQVCVAVCGGVPSSNRWCIQQAIDECCVDTYLKFVA